ncbi:MAG: hypothetical protein K2Q13_02470 [Nitrosomonas sp.]|nr:hypothetical protein [Nitrosomonas sp.]MBY0473909.1 hypothetical protein [Nitrosomonas sp.]
MDTAISRMLIIGNRKYAALKWQGYTPVAQPETQPDKLILVGYSHTHVL